MAAYKILVIDDSRVIRNMVRDLLPTAQFDVIEAPDGIKGLEAAKSERPWLIMLDFLLPKMSGYDVYQNLQQDPELAYTPLVLMSGRKEEVTSKISEPFSDHFLAFIEKPFEKNELVQAIKMARSLAERKPRVTQVPAAAPAPVEAPAAAASSELVQRLQKLEEKVTLIDAMDKRIKALEQQIVTQHKQLQQLVDYIKRKVG
ncbi:MAG: response regulator [Oscillatoriales cyanobacterium SM2_2_1]|nr:response regulator [Oscillatoriales cyanobacterium SM2_2_1]